MRMAPEANDGGRSGLVGSDLSGRGVPLPAPELPKRKDIQMGSPGSVLPPQAGGVRRKRLPPEGEPIAVAEGTYEPIDKSSFPPRMLQMGPSEFENMIVNILDRYFSLGKGK